MIPRYSNKEMSDVWEQKTKFDIWLKIEVLACEEQEKLGKIPKGSSAKIKELANFDIDRIDEIEKKTKHDVIAFLTSVSEYVGSPSKYIHNGMTSSDVIDTALSVQLRKASNILIKNLKELLLVLKDRAIESKHMLCIGRSHGIHAEPITMGLKFAYAYSEFNRSLRRLVRAKEEISYCKISGPVGNYSSIDPSVEKYVAKKLSLKAESISTQIIPRDRHAYYFSILAIMASSIERLSTEIRHLQRTEVREVEEYFSSGQKGSSAMPHKRNPILSENLSGLARYIRSLALPAMENVALWHERDISHSSVERFIAPDSTITLNFAIKRLTKMMKDLIIYPKQMLKNLNKLRGLHFSQKVLLKLIDNKISREDAYLIVQENAMKAWKEVDNNNDNNKDFLYFLSKDKRVNSKINKKDLKSIFNNTSYTEHVDLIFTKVFSS